MVTLACTIGGVSVNIYRQAQVQEQAAQRSTFTLGVIDMTNTLVITQNMVVNLQEDGIDKFNGYVDSADRSVKVGVSNTFSVWDVKCKDNSYLADKDVYTGKELANVTAGDAAVLVHQNALAPQGVLADYAIDIDNSQSSWAVGTHTNTVATVDGLQIAAAGTTFTKKESTDTDWNAGTKDSSLGVFGTDLLLNGTNAMKLTGTSHELAGANMYAYYRFFKFSGRTAHTNDVLSYGLWIAGDSPVICGGVDLVFTDGTTLRDTTYQGNYAVDYFQQRAHPKTDLGWLARDTWYWRGIPIPASCNNKTLSYAAIALEGDKNGVYTIYVRDVVYKNSGGTVLDTCFNWQSVPKFTKLGSTGYTDLKLSVVRIYEKSGQRVSPAYQNTSCDILRQSLVSWTATESVQRVVSGVTYPPQIKIEVSFDNGYTWVECINKQPVPNMYAGLKLTNKYIKFRQTLNMGGPSPEASPLLHDCSITFTPSYAAATTDISDADKAGDSSMGTGTLTRVTNGSATDGLYLTGYYRHWELTSNSSQTLYYSNNAWQEILADDFELTVVGVGDGKVKFDFAGQHQDFTAEIDIQLTNNNGLYGMLYRTTYWGNGNNTYGYFAAITPTTVVLGRGTNTSSGAWTQIAVASPMAFQVGNWYHMKVVASGSTHQIYIDDVLLIDTTNSWYTGTGYLGLRYYNDQASTTQESFFHDFGVIDSTTMDGTRTHPSTSISSVGVIENSLIQWDADVPDPCTYTVSASLDGGSTFLPCTNGAAIPGCEAGENVTGKSLLIKETLETESAVYTPRVYGIAWVVSSDFHAVGTRSSPLQSIVGVGYVGDSSFSWDSDEPANTSVVGKTSLDGSTYTAIDNGDSLYSLVSMPDAVGDDFLVDSHADYTLTNQSGGTAPSLVFDTANSRVLISGGNTGHAIWTKAYLYDGILTAIVSESDAAGFTMRISNVSNFYRFLLRDSNAVSNKQTLTVTRMLAGTATQLTQVAIPFLHDTYHTIQITLHGGQIDVLWDGASVYSYYDASSPPAAGNAGLYSSTGGLLVCYSIAMQTIGSLALSTTTGTQLVLTSDNPLFSPTVRSAVMSVRSMDIMSGNLLTTVGYQYKKATKCLDDIASSSKMTWKIKKDKHLRLYNRAAQLAPWPLSTADILRSSAPKLVGLSPAYRNRQYVTNAYELVDVTEQKLGNSYASSWALKYPVASISLLTVNGQFKNIKLGETTGQDYYVTNSNILAQDESLDLLTDEQVLTISYVGKKPYVAMKEDTVSQALLASIDGCPGGYSVVSDVEDGGGCDKTTADNLAQYRLDTNCILSRDWAFSTARGGLDVGQLLTSFVPEYNLADADMLITGVTTSYKMRGTSAVATYDVSCTEGPPLGTWVRLFE